MSTESAQIQSGASSQAKHGGVCFSAVRGSIEDPMLFQDRMKSKNVRNLLAVLNQSLLSCPHLRTASAPQ